MKVEFIYDYELSIGGALFIDGGEFLKADKDDDEMDSMYFAIDAFTRLSGIREKSIFQLEDYEYLKKYVTKTSAVILSIDKYKGRKILEIYISEKNKMRRAISIVDHGDKDYEMPVLKAKAERKTK